MRPNKVKALWREGKPATAGWLSSGDPYIAEVMANAGYDALIIDMQHGMGVTGDRAIACLQAISTSEPLSGDMRATLVGRRKLARGTATQPPQDH